MMSILGVSDWMSDFLSDALPLLDRKAKRTWMRAIERLRNCLPQRRMLRIFDDHRCPGHGLQGEPMQTDCATKRENCNGAAQAAKHDFRLVIVPGNVNKLVGRLHRGRGLHDEIGP